MPTIGTGDYKETHSAVRSVAIDVSGGNQTIAAGARGVYVGGDGTLVCRLVGDTTDRTFAGLVAGTILPVVINRVTQSGTTVTSSVVLF